MATADTGVRVDKWLWAARFFKTRAQAREAVLGGKVHLGGNRVKPGRALKAGDQLTVSRGEEQFDITIKILSARRVSAPQAKDMFHEDPASVSRRVAAEVQRKIDREANVGPARRPDKRERRQILGFTRGQD